MMNLSTKPNISLQGLYQEKLKRNSLSSIDFFTEKILGFQNKDFHKDWYSFIENEKNHQVIILAPRSHAKTTCLSINYPLWLIAKNPNVRIILASNTVSQSQSFLREITSRIEQDKKYRSICGNLKPEIPIKWTDNEIIINRDKTFKDATISCVGTGGTVLTKRADVIVCDDILDAENTATADQRRKVKDWFYRVLLPCLEPDGKLVVIGTRWNIQDLYGELLEDKSFRVRKTYKAIQDNGSALWEERWSLEKLKEKKVQAGSLIFGQQYQNEPLDPETSLFKSKWIRFYNPDEIDISTLDIYGSLDPAISKKETADYSVFTTVGVDKKGKIYVIDVERDRLTVAEQINMILDKFSIFKHQVIGIESVAFQSVIKSELDRVSQEKRIYVPTEELRPNADKYRRAMSLTPFFENGIIFLKENQTDLVDELLQFPLGKHDDCVDSLCYAVEMVKEAPSDRLLTIIGGEKKDEEEIKAEPEEPRRWKIGKLKRR